MKPRRLQTSVKQILWRDYNWRMGSLRRAFYPSTYHASGLDRDILEGIQNLIQTQMDRETEKHNARLKALEDSGETAGSFEMLTEDPILAGALAEAEFNQWQMRQRES